MSFVVKLTLQIVGVIVCLIALQAYFGATTSQSLYEAADRLRASEQRLEAAKARLGRATDETCRIFGGNCGK